MADIIKTSNTLSIEAGFKDGDTRAISVENPNTAINLSSAIKTLGTYVKTNNLLVGDKAGADFDRFNSAKIVQRTTVYLDLAAGA